MREHHTEAISEIEALARHCVRTHARLYVSSDSIEFEREGEMLIVRGIVPTYNLKQLLQTALLAVDGIQRVDNQVEVSPRPDSGSQ